MQCVYICVHICGVCICICIWDRVCSVDVMRHVKEKDLAREGHESLKSALLTAAFKSACDTLLKAVGTDTVDITLVKSKIQGLFAARGMEGCDLLVRFIHEDAVVYIGETQKEVAFAGATDTCGMDDDDGTIKATRHSSGTKIEVSRKVLADTGVDRLQRKIVFNSDNFTRGRSNGACDGSDGTGANVGYAPLSVNTA